VNDIVHDVTECITEKVESGKTIMKEAMEYTSETITNGISEINGHKEVEAAE